MHAYVMNQQFGHLSICMSIEILYLYCFCEVYIAGIYMYLTVYIVVIHFCFYLKIEIPITGEQEPGAPVVCLETTAGEQVLGSPVVRGLPLANKAVVRQR